MWTYNYSNAYSLYHTGVLGMKWGHHKPTEPTASIKKSKHRTSLEEKYKSDGMTQKDAEIAADKRIKTEKVIAAVAGLTIAAAATYIAVNHYQNAVDKTIKAGKELQNISTNGNKGVEDAFYASLGKRDNTKYRGIYGMQLRGGFDSHPVYETKMKVTKDIKLASRDTASKTFKHLVENYPEFKKAVTDHFSDIEYPTPKQNALNRRAVEKLKKGIADPKVYEAFNLSLTEHSNDQANKAARTFYDTLKSKGYDAIQDINDRKYSGYHSSTPTIFFGGSRALTVDRVRELTSDEIQKNKRIAYADIIGTDAVKKGAIVTGSILGVKSAKKQVSNIVKK